MSEPRDDYMENYNIPAYQVRLYAEIAEVRDKHNELKDFISGITFINGQNHHELSEEEKDLLAKQLLYMKGYIGILEQRIARFNP